jgi:hypothetical protein
MPGKELVPRPAVSPPDVARPPWEQRVRKEPSPTAWQWLRRRHHWTLPAFLPVPVLAAGAAVHAYHLGGYVLAVGAAVLAGVALFGGIKWSRGPELLYACLSALALTSWLAVAAWYGPAHLGMLIALAVLAAAWGFPWWRHKRPRGQRKRQKRIGKWDTWWQSHAWSWNLGGSKVIDVQEMNLTTKVRVQGLAGRHSVQHVNQVMHLIESGLDGFADIGMVRVEAVKGHANWFDFYFKRENPLKGIVEYDPALAPRSVHEDIAVGLKESGTWKTIPARCNRFVIGASRTGKSNDLLGCLAALTGVPDDVQIIIDLKGGRSARPVLKAGAAGYVITELDEARMCERMLNAEIDARAKYAPDDDEQLAATIEDPALHLIIDEVHGLTSVPNGDAECAAKLALIASKGMGLEVYVWVFTQHGSLEDSVRTEQTRFNLPVRTVYRVEQARHGAYGIEEYNKLDASKLEEKGTAYWKDGPHATAEQVRGPHMPHKLLEQVAAQNAALVHRPPLQLYCGDQDAGNGQTWQEWWDTRWLRLDPAFHDISPQYQAAAASSPAEAFAAMPEPPEPAPAPAPGEGDAAQAAARIQAELDEVHRGLPRDFKPAKVNLAPVIALQKDAFATALESAPPGGISPKQLAEESGRGRTWVHGQLTALVDLGVVTQIGYGRYAPVDGHDIRRALAAIKENGDRLHREARRMVNTA